LTVLLIFFQVASARRHRNDLGCLRVKLPPVTTSVDRNFDWEEPKLKNFVTLVW